MFKFPVSMNVLVEVKKKKKLRFNRPKNGRAASTAQTGFWAGLALAWPRRYHSKPQVAPNVAASHGPLTAQEQSQSTVGSRASLGAAPPLLRACFRLKWRGTLDPACWNGNYQAGRAVHYCVVSFQAPRHAASDGPVAVAVSSTLTFVRPVSRRRGPTLLRALAPFKCVKIVLDF